MNEYSALCLKYVGTHAETTILGHTHKETITMGINPFYQDFNMVHVLWYIGPMAGLSCNLSNAPTSLRFFILVFISSLYLIIHAVMIEEEETG